MGSSHDLHLHGTIINRKKYIYAPSRIRIHYLRVPAAENSIAHASIRLCTLKSKFPIFFERSHSDESTWSNNEQRRSSVRCLALCGANCLVIVVLHLVKRTVLIFSACWELPVPCYCFYRLCSLAQKNARTPGTTSTQVDRVALRSALTTLEQNCANVDSDNGYCLGVLTSIYFRTRCHL